MTPTCRLLPVALALVGSGCIAFPLAIPPAQVQIGGGGRYLKSDTVNGYDAQAQLRAAVHPLGLFPSLLERRGDVAAGYLLDLGQRAVVQGAFLDGGYVILSLPSDEDDLLRLSVRAQARLLHSDLQKAWGPGAAAQLELEFVHFTDGNFETSSGDGGAMGYAYGESGFGLYVEGAYLKTGPMQGWAISGGLTVRMPAAAGMGYVWAWALLK